MELAWECRQDACEARTACPPPQGGVGVQCCQSAKQPLGEKWASLCPGHLRRGRWGLVPDTTDGCGHLHTA